MFPRSRTAYRRYSTPRYSVTRRAHGGCLASLLRLVMDLLQGLLLILVAVVLGVLLFALLTHLSQIEAAGACLGSLLSTYGPLALLVLSLLAAVFVVLGVVYALVRLLAAISETCSFAALARARAAQEKARARYARNIPLVYYAGPRRRRSALPRPVRYTV